MCDYDEPIDLEDSYEPAEIGDWMLEDLKTHIIGAIAVIPELTKAWNSLTEETRQSFLDDIIVSVENLM